MTALLAGTRQVGKTTLANQAMKYLHSAAHYASADEPNLQASTWIEQQWEIGRLTAISGQKREIAVLVLDEIQKLIISI